MNPTSGRRERIPREREDALRAIPAGGAASVALIGILALLGAVPARAQGAPSWLDPALIAAAKAEGALVVYSSTNEQEGLPLFKLFTDATGIKVDYVRASDAV